MFMAAFSQQRKPRNDPKCPSAGEPYTRCVSGSVDYYTATESGNTYTRSRGRVSESFSGAKQPVRKEHAPHDPVSVELRKCRVIHSDGNGRPIARDRCQGPVGSRVDRREAETAFSGRQNALNLVMVVVS